MLPTKKTKTPKQDENNPFRKRREAFIFRHSHADAVPIAVKEWRFLFADKYDTYVVKCPCGQSLKNTFNYVNINTSVCVSLGKDCCNELDMEFKPLPSDSHTNTFEAFESNKSGVVLSKEYYEQIIYKSLHQEVKSCHKLGDINDVMTKIRAFIQLYKMVFLQKLLDEVEAKHAVEVENDRLLREQEWRVFEKNRLLREQQRNEREKYDAEHQAEYQAEIDRMKQERITKQAEQMKRDQACTDKFLADEQQAKLRKQKLIDDHNEYIKNNPPPVVPKYVAPDFNASLKDKYKQMPQDKLKYAIEHADDYTTNEYRIIITEYNTRLDNPKQLKQSKINW